MDPAYYAFLPSVLLIPSFWLCLRVIRDFQIDKKRQMQLANWNLLDNHCRSGLSKVSGCQDETEPKFRLLTNI